MTRITFVSLCAAIWLLLVVVELVRRRRLGERYALLWLLTGAVVLLLAAWPAALERFSDAVGIAYPPTALFVVAGGFVLLVLLHYATVISGLTERNVRLAQRVAILEERLLTAGARRRAPTGGRTGRAAARPARRGARRRPRRAARRRRMNLRATGVHRRRALVTSYRVARAAAARVGVQFVVKSYYSPIPDLRALPADVWDRRSELRGVDLDLDAAFARAEAMLGALGRRAARRRPRGAAERVLQLGRRPPAARDGPRAAARPRASSSARASRRCVLAGACRRNAAEGDPVALRGRRPLPDRRAAGHAGIAAFRREPRGDADRCDWFEQLGEGDVLFVDTTHTVKLGSDVNRIVLDVLPAAAAGRDRALPRRLPALRVPARLARGLRAATGASSTCCRPSSAATRRGRCSCRCTRSRAQDEARLRAVLPGAPAGLGPGAFWIRRRPA